MQAPFRIELAQGRLADPPAQDVPGADVSVHTFNLSPPVLRLPAFVVGIIASDGTNKVVVLV